MPLARRDADGNPPAPPELLTSFGDFVRIYGGLGDLPLGGPARTNHLAHAVLNFFNEGGSRLFLTADIFDPLEWLGAAKLLSAEALVELGDDYGHLFRAVASGRVLARVTDPA